MHWIRATLSELEAQQPNPTVVQQDNLGAVSWTTEIQGLQKFKHIGIRYQFVQDAVDKEAIKVAYVSCADSKSEGLR